MRCPVPGGLHRDDFEVGRSLGRTLSRRRRRIVSVTTRRNVRVARRGRRASAESWLADAQTRPPAVFPAKLPTSIARPSQLPSQPRTMNPARIRAIYRRLREANPEPVTELEYSTPFELLVAVMLSAHTTDKSVNAATRKLYPVANTPAKILALGEEGVKPYLKTVGLYNAKSKNLIELMPPNSGAAPGRGAERSRSAGIAAGRGAQDGQCDPEHRVRPHDDRGGHDIFRVANRTGIAPGKNPRLVEDELNEVTPDEYKRNAHHWLLLHGRYVCVARLPACPECIIADLCEYTLKTPPKDLPKSDAPVARAGGAPAKPKVVRGKRVAATERSAVPARTPNGAKTRGRAKRASSSPSRSRAR